MKSHDNSIMRRLSAWGRLTVLTLIIGIFLAVTLVGCHDPSDIDIKAEHRKLTEVAKQQLQLRHGLSTFPLTSQTETFYPVP